MPQVQGGGDLCVPRGGGNQRERRNEAFAATIDGSGDPARDMEYGNWNGDECFSVMVAFCRKSPKIVAVLVTDEKALDFHCEVSPL